MGSQSNSRAAKQPVNVKKGDKADIKGRLPKSMVSLVQELQSHIQSLRIVIVLLLVVLVYSTYSSVSARDELVVHIPPDLTNGATMQVGEIPRASVFIYTSHLWLEFNTWMDNGNKDAFANMAAYREYFAPNFLKLMSNEYEGKRSRGELDRQRRLSLLPGNTVEAMKRVNPISKNSWVVYLDVIDEEFYLGERVKNAKIRYSLLVERVETSVEKNPVGVRIVGFKEQPTLLGEL